MPVSKCGMSMASNTLDTGPAISTPPSKDAENDRGDGRALDPAVGDHQLPGGKQFGKYPVLGGRIRGRAESDQRIGRERMQGEQHQRTAQDLDAVGDQHHAALGHGIREGTDQRREHHVGDHEALLEGRGHPRGRVQVAQHLDRSDEQRVVGERRKKLRRHDGVEPGLHCPRLREFSPFPPTRQSAPGCVRCACV